MSRPGSAIVKRREALSWSRNFSSTSWALLGVIGFSLSLPATKLAVATIDGWVVGMGRALVAAVLALIALCAMRVAPPPRVLWPRLCVVIAGAIVGFPLLAALALQTVPSAHGAIVVGLLPAATAVAGVLQAHERPPLRFWTASLVGLAAIVAFCSISGLGRLQIADLYLLASVVCAACGYAEGALLARLLGAWQVTCWALVASAPLILPFVAWRIYQHGWHPSPGSLAGFAYVSLIAMFFAYFAWYRGLALGGIARVGQLQLIQPVLTLLWGALFLGERVAWLHAVTAAIVLGSVASALSWRGAVVPAPRMST